MCDAITLVGIGLSAGSTVVNSMAASKVARARQDAMAAERVRQAQYQQQADALNAQSRARYDDFGAQQQKEGQDLAAYYQSANTAGDSTKAPQTDPNAATGSGLPSSSSQIVQTEQAKQGAKARAFTDQQAVALGGLRSFGTLMGDIGRAQARDAQTVGQVGNFMRGSSAVLPYELDAANRSASGMKMMGDLLGGAGSIATSYGISGGTPDKLAGSISSMFAPQGTVGLTSGASWLKG